MSDVIKGKTYHLQVSFDEILCTPPKDIVILEGGQAIARYAEDPPVPYDSLLDLLEDHAQGCLDADGIRARMQDAGGDEEFTPLQLKALKKTAVEYWGEFAVKFNHPAAQ